MEKITVVVPIYNVEKYLEKCLNCIINQTYTNLQIILVNDGSTDNSLKIANEFAKKDSRIQVISQKNAGVSAARNTALDAATGKYICFIDSDDPVEPDHIEGMYNALINSNSDISTCLKKYVKIKNYKPNIKQKKYSEKVFKKEDAIKEIFLYKNFECSVTCKLFKLDVIGSQRFPTHTYHGEDLWFLYEYVKKISKLISTNAVTYHYIQHNQSICNRRFDPRRMILINTLKQVAEDVKKNYPAAYNYAMGWIFLVYIETLYMMKKWKYKDKSLKKELKLGLKEHLKYNKLVRKHYASYRKFSHLVYPMFMMF